MSLSQTELFEKDKKEMMIFSTKEKGDIGEEYAVNYLKKQKYQIKDRNFRLRMGEIDIIAQKGDLLAFVEVKTRHSNSFTQPYEAVDFRKQQKIIQAAKTYLCQKRLDMYCRFDVCEVFINKETLKLEKIHYIENAFE